MQNQINKNNMPYHPMGDGQTERMSRTIINLLITLNETEKSRWKDHLPKLIFEYNSTINKSTGYSPFFFMFGKYSKLPVDSIFDVQNSSNDQKSYDKFVAEWKESMQQAIDIASKNADKARRLNKTNYDRKLYGNDLNLGGQVLLKNNLGLSGTDKLRSDWKDPIYIVTKKSRQHTCLRHQTRAL